MNRSDPQLGAELDADASDPYSYALPFVVAVVGHRDLDAEQYELVKREFTKVLKLVLAALPHTPVVVLSGLADGADRAFAEATLDLRDSLGLSGRAPIGHRLTLAAPLPMPLDRYRSTFGVRKSPPDTDAAAQERSNEEFQALIGRAQASQGSTFAAYVADAGGLNECIAQRVLAQQERMRVAGDSAAQCHDVEAYAVHSRYLLMRAHLLVAAWDGDDSTKPRLCGGTADTVTTHREGFPPVDDPRSARRFYESNRGSVVQIRVVRRSTQPAVGEGPSGPPLELLPPEAMTATEKEETEQFAPPSISDLFSSPWRSAAQWLDYRGQQKSLPVGTGDSEEMRIARAVWHVGREQDTINREHGQCLALEGTAYIHKLKASATALSVSLGPHDDLWPLRTGMSGPLKRFGMTDVLAVKLQGAWRQRWIAIAAGTVLAGIASVVKLMAPAHAELAEAAVFMSGAFVAIAVYAWVTLSPLRDAYLDCRAIAEGLRFQLYWRAAGLPNPVTNHYVLKWRDELGWVRRAIDGASTAPPIEPLAPWLVCNAWIEAQLGYLDKGGKGATIKLRDQLNKSINELGGYLLLAGLFLGLLAWAVAASWTGAIARDVTAWLVAAMKTAPAVGAALLAFNSKMANADSVKQAKHMVGIYRKAEAELFRIGQDPSDREKQDPQIRNLMEALGKEALAENTSWLMMHRQRKVSWHGKS